MNIAVEIHTLPLLQRFKNSDRKLAYAAIGALTDTARAIQVAEQNRVRSVLHVRRPTFVDREIAKIIFASVPRSRPYAEVFIDEKPRSFLSLLEQGGERPHGRRNEVALTGEAVRPSSSEVVTPALRLNKLRLHRERRHAGPVSRNRTHANPKAVFQGAQRTYAIEDVGIFKRFGPHDTRLEYLEKPDVHLPGELQWLATARNVYERTFHEQLERRTIDALGHGGFLG